MKKMLLNTLFAAVLVLLSSCSTPYSLLSSWASPPPDETKFNYSSDDPYRQGQHLVEAIAHGAYSATYRLMENGAPLNYQDKKDEWSPLIYAIYYKRWSISRVLIRAGANVNLADSANRTPLMWSALRNSGITARLLVEYGANINAVDLSGRTALQYAIIYNNTSLASYLAEAGRKPPEMRLRKEQFSRLEFKRAKEAAEKENIKVFGNKREREVIADLKKKGINRNIKKNDISKDTTKDHKKEDISKKLNISAEKAAEEYKSTLGKKDTKNIAPSPPEKDPDKKATGKIKIHDLIKKIKEDKKTEPAKNIKPVIKAPAEPEIKTPAKTTATVKPLAVVKEKTLEAPATIKLDDIVDKPVEKDSAK